MSMKLLVLISGLALIKGHILFGQNHLQMACAELIHASFIDTFDWGKIQMQSSVFHQVLRMADLEDYESCNCADTFWIKLWNDQRQPMRLYEFPFEGKNYLRQLVSDLDLYNLNYEFNHYSFKTPADSFYYAIERMRSKLKRSDLSKYEFKKFYWCIDPEIEFLKQNRDALQDHLFDVFDNYSEEDRIRDIVLVVWFNSNSSIEKEILTRIDKIENAQFFPRFTGILSTSGSTASVIYFTNYLRNHSLSLNEIKIILQTINSIMARTNVKPKVRKSYLNHLKETQLDSLTEYELFLRDNN